MGMVLPGKGRKRRKRRVVEAKAGARARKAGSRVGAKSGSRAASRPAKLSRKAAGKLPGRVPVGLRGDTLASPPAKIPGKISSKIPGKIPGKVSEKTSGRKPVLVRPGEARRSEPLVEVGPNQGANPATGEADRARATDPPRGRGSRKVDARGVSVAVGVLRPGKEISVSASAERPQVGIGSMVAGRVGAVLDPDGSSLPVPIASFLI
jgi:hypothetical protein